MHLRIFLPNGLFASVEGVTRIVAVTPGGSYGLLPHRLDCATALAPGLLSYSTGDGLQIHLAIDAGVLVKTGADVRVCVRHAIAGADLGALRSMVDRQFLDLSEQEKQIRSTLAQLEGGLIRAFVELRRG